MRSDWCVYGRWIQNIKSDETRWEQGDGKRVYDRWAIDDTLPSIASEIMRIRTLNKGVIIPFFHISFFNEG